MDAITFTPLVTDMCLQNGLDPGTSAYDAFLGALEKIAPNDKVSIPGRPKAVNTQKYTDIAEDDYDLRIMIWQSAVDPQGRRVRFHVYPRMITIAEVILPNLSGAPAEALAETILETSQALVAAEKAALDDFLVRCHEQLSNSYFDPRPLPSADIARSIGYTARALIFEDAERKAPGFEAFAEAWLKETARPEDAHTIAAGKTHYSMTWLNYIIVRDDSVNERLLISAMRIAQYFYAAQEMMNTQTQSLIYSAQNADKIRHAETLLKQASGDMQLLRIQFDVQYNLINLNKRKVLDAILDVWNFDRLVANGERMVAASKAKIADISSARQDLGSLITDMILVVIAFLTIIDLAIQLTEYSREMMSRPALAYVDDSPSWVLAMIASIDADTMIVGGFLTIVVLVALYAFWKFRR